MLGGVERNVGWSGGPSAEGARQAQPPTSRPGRLQGKSLAGVVGGGAAGFVLGAAFWIVLGLQEIAGSGAPNLSPVRDPQGLHAPGCTALALDRRQGHTTAEPCLHHVLPLREARASPGDRALP